MLNIKIRTNIFRRLLFFRKTVTFFLVLLLCLNGYCRESEEGSTDAYVFSGIADARILIPFFADDTTSSSICEFIYNGLTKIDKDLKIVPDLAESWKVEEEGLRITFYLRHDVVWHDGEPFTAGDVYFTFKKILDPGTGCPYISNYSGIKDIEIIDDHTIRFYYSQPYAPALLKFGMGIIPEHLFGKITDIRGSVYAVKPIGTGPYKFSIWKNAQYMVLAANPDYFEHMPRIKRYVYRVVPDQSVQFLELVSGDIDSMGLSPYQFLYRSNTPEFKDRIEKYRYLARSYTYIGYNLKDPLFKDKNVRRALSYAINKKEIIDAALLGLGDECTGPFFKDTVYYDDAAERYSYDMVKAALLLRQAGWSDVDNDGVLEKDGKKFVFRIVTNQGNQVREDVATIIQAQWAKIGVKVDIQVLAWSAFLDQFINKKNFQAVILGWSLPVDPDIYAVWHSDSSKEGGLNFVSYSNPEVDQLIELGRGKFDINERAKIYKRIHCLISEDVPYTFLFFPYSTIAVQKRFKGIEPAPAGIGYNFIDWYVKNDEVRYKF
ncbi:MAG: peptide-binding protein [Candidatus Omnitrophica bacterium]|nr:peptide-binding protein [Candidatus Omnitrophota bacterium]